MIDMPPLFRAFVANANFAIDILRLGVIIILVFAAVLESADRHV